MHKNRNLDFENVLAECNFLCSKCDNSLQKQTILPMKNGNVSNFQSLDKLSKVKPFGLNTSALRFNDCQAANALFDCARNLASISNSQFERVENFHVAVSCIEENCSGPVASEARRLLEHEWARVLLFTHNALPNLSKILGDIVDDRALARTIGLGLNVFKENTFTQVEQMLNFIERRRSLNALYNLVNDCLDELSAKSKETANLRFFKRKSAAQAATLLNVSLRTVQRRTERLLDEMRAVMPSHGLDINKLLWWLGKSEPWVLEWFRL